MVSCYKLLGVRAFVLEVRSWSGSKGSCKSPLKHILFCSDKEGQGPKAELSRSKVQVLAKRRGFPRGRLPSPGVFI